MPDRSRRKPRTRAPAKHNEAENKLRDAVTDAQADMVGREFIDVFLWRITVPLSPPPKDVEARRILEGTPLTPQERIEQKSQARAAEGEVTIEVRVTAECVELDEPDPPANEMLNRWAWDRIQERYAQPVRLRLDQGLPVVTAGDGLPIPGQRADRYGRRSAVSPADLIDRLSRCTYMPQLTDDELARLRAHLIAPVSYSRPHRDPAERARRAKLKEIQIYNDELRRTNAVVPDPAPPVNTPTRPALAESCTVAALREMTGLENTALNRYAKLAKVATARRGQRNFRYSAADVRAILETIIAKTSEDILRAKCRAVLQNLREIAK